MSGCSTIITRGGTHEPKDAQAETRLAFTYHGVVWFIGTGETTLLSLILQADHSHGIAVIENEYDKAGIVAELRVTDHIEPVVEVHNGCICCTGLADPSPVSHPSFFDDDTGMHGPLGGALYREDTVHAPQQLNQDQNARRQVGFAGPIVLAQINAILGIETNLPGDAAHAHEDHQTSFRFRETQPEELEHPGGFLGAVLWACGTHLMRHKGILDVVGLARRVVPQGVDMPKDLLIRRPQQTVAVTAGGVK